MSDGTRRTALRIALVAPFGLRTKGTTRARVVPLARALARRGHAVAVFIPPYDSPEDSGLCWTDAGAEIVNVRLPRLGAGTPLWHFALANRLLVAVRAWRPQLIHVFKPKGPSGLVGAAEWMLRHAPDAHVPGTSRPMGVPGTFERLVVDADDWEGPGGWNDDPRAGYSWLQRRFFAWQERHGLSHADAWTVTSQCLRERAIAFGADEGHVHVLHNGAAADENAFSSPPAWGEPGSLREQGAGGHNPGVLLYTRFAGTRPADVAAIWARIRAAMPGARLTVIGRGVGDEEQRLAGVAGIDVAGWVEADRLPLLFALASVAIVPWADTPSNRARHSAKVLELMAAGLPIIAYAVGELPATVGDAGLLVAPGDTEAFARAVVDLMADAERRRQLGAAAQARVRAHFTWEKLADVALAAYGRENT